MAEARKRRKSDDIRRANQVIRGRTVWLMAIFGVATFLLLFWKLFDLQILRHEELESKAVSQQTRSSIITASRGTIYDRGGEVLAISTTAETVNISPKDIASFVDDQEKMRSIIRLFPEAMAVDMESAAIAQTCHVFGIPFVSFRVISDIPLKDTKASQYHDFWAHVVDTSFATTRRFLEQL